MNRFRILYQNLLLWLFFHRIIRRIKIPMIQAAQRKTKLGLVKGRYFSESRKAACPLGMLTAAKLRMEVPKVHGFHSSKTADDILKIPFGYSIGFQNGFDTKWNFAEFHKDRAPVLSPQHQRDYERGYEDGQKARVLL